mmetsp:Transcript_20159/g.35827  ORF Transcript_20159/g.35827 Transcript_20159/m.35827 type:complete len:325 (-) Transcript_20159:214-1188(-)
MSRATAGPGSMSARNTLPSVAVRRPWSAVNRAGLQDHFKAARAAAADCVDDSLCRPQRGSGAPAAAFENLRSAVGQLVRVTERGEITPLALLLECLRHISSLELNASGGDSLLWMVKPVLQASRTQLLQDNNDRQLFEAEVAGLRLLMESLSLEAEDQIAWQIRSEEKFITRHQKGKKEAQALREETATMRQERERLEAESLQLQKQELLSRERQIWEEEHGKLEAEVASLEASIAKLEEQKESLEEPADFAEAHLEGIMQRLADIHPDFVRQETLRKTLVRVEDEIEDLERNLENLEQKRHTKRSGTGRRRSSRRKSSAGSLL